VGTLRVEIEKNQQLPTLMNMLTIENLKMKQHRHQIEREHTE
jgi:hypothetical protein